MGFLSTSDAFNFIQEGQTDANSGVNELLTSFLRKNFEQLLIKLFYTGVSGTLTSTPTAAGVCTNTSASMGVDDHIGHTVIFIDGAAAGNPYTIDDNDATTFTLTGDDPAADGVLSGDSYMIFYDLLNYTSAYTHDGVQGPPLVPYRMSLASAMYSTALENFGTSWSTVETIYVYLPEGAETISMYSKIATTNSSYTAYSRFYISGLYSGSSSSQSTSGEWVGSVSANVSSLSAGWYQVSLQLAASTSTEAYLHGFNLFVE